MKKIAELKAEYNRGWESDKNLRRFPKRLKEEQASLHLDGVTINNDFPSQMSTNMDGFLDIIAAVVTTDSKTMQQMVVAVATLTKTNKQQTATIASQQKTITTLGLGLTKQSATSKTMSGTTWEPHPGYETGVSALREKILS